MSRKFAMVVFLFLLVLPATTWAQRGGGRGGGGRGGGIGVTHTAPAAPFGGRPAMQAPHPTAAIGLPPGVTSFGHAPAPFARAPIGHSFGSFGHARGRGVQPIIVPQPFGFGFYSPFSPYPFYSDPFYSNTFYSNPPYATAPAVESPVVSQNDVDLTYQVQQLSQEVERLRQDQALSVQRLPQPSVPQAPPTPIVLVFRDGHQIQIQNYAVVGQTFWVLDERSSTKVSVADLDLDATQRENRARGVRFPNLEK